MSEKVLFLGEALLTPTRIYSEPQVLTALQSGQVKAAAHITGGGLLDNIPRVLPDDLKVRLDANRSEERRVGKECRSRWSPYH